MKVMDITHTNAFSMSMIRNILQCGMVGFCILNLEIESCQHCPQDEAIL